MNGPPCAPLPNREALLAEAERVAQLGSWAWNLATGEIEWSDELYRIFGLEPRSVAATAERFFAAIDPLDRARVQEEAADAIATGRFLPSEFNVVRASGERRRVRLHGGFLAGPQGERSYVVGTIIDLTDGQRSDEVIFRTADELKRAQGVARMGSFTWLLEPPRLEWSPGMYRLLGLSGNEPPSLELFNRHVHPDDLQYLLSRRAEALETGVPVPIEFRVVSAGGTVLNVELESQDVRDASGNLQGFRGVLQDVTRRRALEEQLRHAQKMEAIGTLAGGVAHDFNNYLMILTGQAELIQMSLERDHPLQRAVEAILSASDRCTALTSQLLTLSRKRKVERRPINLSAMIRRLTPVLRTALGEAISVTVIEDEPELSVLADEGQIEQVLMNLALNARDAMLGTGSLSLTVERVLDEPRGSYVRLSVSDNGQGIPPECRARIFEPFYTTKRTGHGTGLGLSTVYGIMQEAGGRIEVESELGRGTTFHVYWLPASSEQSPSLSVTPAAPLPTVSRTVLLVEDVSELRELLRQQLERAGHHVLSAENGVDALRLLESAARHVEVVVSDVVMPAMGGLELRRRLSQLYPWLPCILMTGYADGLLQDKSVEHELLRKPFAVRQLLEALERACRTRALRAEP